MIDTMACKTGRGQVRMMSEEDYELLDQYYINEPLRMKLTRASEVKVRSYRELCCYKSSCTYIANMNFNEDMNTHKKVDCLTKIRCDFTDGHVYDDKTKRTSWMAKSLSYANCDQPESHAFIAKALEMHAGLIGLSVDNYIILLNNQK